MKTSENKNCILIMCRDASVNQAYISSLLFRKYWKDCPYELILCTQTVLPVENMYDRVILTDDKMIWGNRLDVALSQIDTESVIICPEDSFLQMTVDTKKIQDCISFMEKENGGAIRLKPPMHYVEKYNEKYDIVPKKAVYRLCLHPTLFKTEYLRNFAVRHYSPWQYERQGSLQSREYPEQIFCAREALYDSIHAWSGGCWLKEAYRLMEKEKIPESLYKDAPVYPWYRELKDKVAMHILNIAPEMITRIRIWQCSRNEKKLET